MTSLIPGSLALFVAFLSGGSGGPSAEGQTLAVCGKIANFPDRDFAAHFYPQQRAEYTGDWYFDRFGGPHGEVSHAPDIEKANKQEAGYKFTFTNNGKFRTVQPDGTTNTTDYGYLVRRREIIIGKDTLKIMLLTAKIMELYPVSGKQPALFLRRNKDEKTAMSAP
ncbi:MAG TPA: hypothetical protein VGS79_17850 [Puia sp.]|nr:hypothetical protein [Puia sp.]